MKENNMKKIRKFVAILIFILFVIVFIKLFSLIIGLNTVEGKLQFQEKVQGLGANGIFLISLLEICKIILIFLPGEPIEIVAGICCGPFWGLVAIYIGVIISNIIIMCLVKKFGIKIVEDVIQEEKIKKVKDLITNNPEKSETTLFVLYFLPTLPKDLITYIACLLPISKRKFLAISIIARFPAVFSSVLVGHKLLYGDIKSIVLIYLTTYVISGVMAIVYKKYEKSCKIVSKS